MQRPKQKHPSINIFLDSRGLLMETATVRERTLHSARRNSLTAAANASGWSAKTKCPAPPTSTIRWFGNSSAKWQAPGGRLQVVAAVNHQHGSRNLAERVAVVVAPAHAEIDG